VTRLEVDRERCVGSGTCEMLAPDVFEVGDDGIVVVLRPEADDGAVHDAVQQCPTQALSQVD
jgi:ferredoxin